jgi:hypothetical protein
MRKITREDERSRNEFFGGEGVGRIDVPGA